MTYEEIKKQFAEHKQKIVLGFCFLLVFIIGFGTGKYEQGSGSTTKPVRANYTTKTSKPATPQVLGETKASPAVQTPAANPKADSSCIVKGNISSAGKKIYHVEGGAFYKIVKPEQCFNTETEARAAGFVKSSR